MRVMGEPPPVEIASPIGPLVVGPVDPASTFVLRQAVLRPHQAVESMALLGSDPRDARVFAAVVPATGEVVSTAAVSPEAVAEELVGVVPPGHEWRLRSMATRPDLRGTGIGRRVLDVALDYVCSTGGGVVWLRGRTPAQSFYERAGFIASGGVWEEPDIGPHILMWQKIDPSEGDGRG